MPQPSTSPSATRPVESKRSLKRMRAALASLRPVLPPGWHDYFSARHAGKHWGLRIQCPKCEARPPADLIYGHQRWRWLSVHLSVAHRLHTNGKSKWHQRG